MAPQKTVPSPPAMYTPTTPVDPDHEAKLKAEARAYALSGSVAGSSSGTKRKSPPSGTKRRCQPKKAAAPAAGTKPTTLNIHRPEKQRKITSKHPRNDQFGVLPEPVGIPKKVSDGDDDDYVRFVRSLGLDDSIFATLDNDDEDFHLSDVDDDDDDDDDAQASSRTSQANGAWDDTKAKFDSTPPLSSPLCPSPMALPDFESDMFRELEDELGNLLEEDMEAAVQSLMTSKKPTSPKLSKTSPKVPKSVTKKQQPKTGAADSNNHACVAGTPTTPLRDAARQGTSAPVTYQQSQQLRRLLTRHYQLLVQQSILAVRAAHTQKAHSQKETKDKSDFLSGETADDLAEILDGAVGMLQDLDQNRRDAIRNSIQLSEARRMGYSSGRRSLLSRFTESTATDECGKDRRLTRAAFSRTLQKQGGRGTKRTAFDIPGLVKLNETFDSIDKSVDGSKGSILEGPMHSEACKMVLRQAGAQIDEAFVPGTRDLSENFCDCKEFFGKGFEPPCSGDQQLSLRRNRNLFTSGEDNLVLRGVNLYGEKQWILIADRYLPDRSVNIISQRYSKLCVMLYRAHGIHIDAKGNLKEPPKLESVDDIDDSLVKKMGLARVEPPAILNVHRWSLEEDLTLLKAVPIMGHMWAELGARLIPHRDRGHLRKRYQVLERRVKATVTRNAKNESNVLKTPRFHGSSRKVHAPTRTSKQPVIKSAPVSSVRNKKVSARKLPTTALSIEKAAASLAGLRPTTKETAMAAEQPVVPAKKSSIANKRPGKEVPTVKATTAAVRKAAPLRRPSPKLPVTKPAPFPQLPQSDVPPAGTDTNTRTAFEKLVEGTNEEWSQMSRMKKMLENDDESQAADAIVSRLAKSPVPNGLSKLPHLQLDTNSMSGLSMLQSEASRQIFPEYEASKPAHQQKISIMARVLENSKGSGAERRESRTESFRNRLLPNLRDIESPVPTTPKRSAFFSTSGTPIGLSPVFHPSPSTRERNGSSLPPGPAYSPAPSTVLRYVNEEPSMDEMKFCDFRISDESRRELETNTGIEQQHDPTPPPLTPSKNSLLFENDMDAMEAISALNSLSNSPFRSTKQSQGETESTETRSLFAQVVGSFKARDAKKKLQF